MQTVRDDDGRRYLLLDVDGATWLVRDPATGETERRDPETLTVRDDRPPLETAAGGVPESARRVLSAAHDDRTLGLLCDLVDRGPTPVRTMLDAYDYCESDLHGRLAEFRAAGLLAETTVAGEPGYEPTESAVEAVEFLRGDSVSG